LYRSFVVPVTNVAPTLGRTNVGYGTGARATPVAPGARPCWYATEYGPVSQSPTVAASVMVVSGIIGAK
jgi:hypothetical protein